MTNFRTMTAKELLNYSELDLSSADLLMWSGRLREELEKRINGDDTEYYSGHYPSGVTIVTKRIDKTISGIQQSLDSFGSPLHKLKRVRELIKQYRGN